MTVGDQSLMGLECLLDVLEGSVMTVGDDRVEGCQIEGFVGEGGDVDR